MGTISQMAERCRKCPDRDKCNHKRMEMCAYIDEPKTITTASIPNEINISMGVGGVLNVGIGDIAKEIEKSISKIRYMRCGW